MTNDQNLKSTIHNPKYEMMARPELERLQLERLKRMVERAAARSPFYQKKLAEARVKEEEIKSLEDITRLPFTTKEEMRYHYPWGLLAVPLKEVVRVHASSGTTGKPVVAGYSRADLAVWAEVMAPDADIGRGDG